MNALHFNDAPFWLVRGFRRLPKTANFIRANWEGLTLTLFSGKLLPARIRDSLHTKYASYAFT
jgi:hypothetical protein